MAAGAANSTSTKQRDGVSPIANKNDASSAGPERDKVSSTTPCKRRHNRPSTTIESLHERRALQMLAAAIRHRTTGARSNAPDLRTDPKYRGHSVQTLDLTRTKTGPRSHFLCKWRIPHKTVKRTSSLNQTSAATAAARGMSTDPQHSQDLGTHTASRRPNLAARNASTPSKDGKLPTMSCVRVTGMILHVYIL
jgi:hypothetical protein